MGGVQASENRTRPRGQGINFGASKLRECQNLSAQLIGNEISVHHFREGGGFDVSSTLRLGLHCCLFSPIFT